MTNSSQLVTIEKPIYGGAFLARAEGKVLFTPLTLPSEQLRVHIVEEKRSFATCEIEEIVQAAPERIEPHCKHFGVCGGCNYQHTNHQTQIKFKTEILQETLARSGVQVPAEIDVLASEQWEYRNRIRLAIDASGRVGYRARRSSQIIPVAECPIAAPVLLRAAFAAEQALRTLPQIGVTEIEFFTNSSDSELLITVLAHTPKNATQWVAAFVHEIPQLTGVELLRVGVGRTVGLNESVAHWGNRSLKYAAADFEYRVDLGAFFQVNRFLVDSLVERVTAGATGDLTWDLYAGVGLFARRLAEEFKQVVAVESAPASKKSLVENLTGVSAAAVHAQTEDFLRQQVGRKHPKRVAPDLIVVDPPRAGIGTKCVDLLNEIGAPKIVYVSCDPATLARDLKGFTAAGYAICSLTMADLFPQTYHIESIVHLERK